MDVDDAPRERGQERGRDELHVAGQHDQLGAALREPGRHREVARLAGRRSRRPGTSPWARRRPRARASACAPGLSEPTATTSAPRAVDAVEDRLEVRAGAGREDADVHATSSFGKRPPVERRRPAREQRVDRGEDLLGAQVAVRAVVRQAVVGVLLDHLRAAAAQDLDAARAPDARRGVRRRPRRIAPSRSTAGASERCRGAAPARRARATDRRRRSTAPVGVGLRRIAEVAQDALAPAAAALDPRPDRAVLAPADARALLGGGAADRQRRAVPRARSRRPATRSGADGAGWITPARAM